MCFLTVAMQYKPITVVRFVIGGTIEERILKLQVSPLAGRQQYVAVPQFLMDLGRLIPKVCLSIQSPVDR